MGGSKGCHDDVAAAIIFVFNSVAMILSIAGLAGISYIWYTQAYPKADREITLSVVVPEAMLGLGIFVCLFVLTIALLGIITTGFEMRANRIARKKRESGKAAKEEVKKDKNGNVIPVKGPKGCCHNAGLLVYIGLSLFAFFFLLAVAVVTGLYSGKLDHVNYVTEAKSTGDPWVQVLDAQVSNAAIALANNYPKTWKDSQTILGCCGWNVTATAATTTAITITAAVGVTTESTTSTTTLPFNHANVLAYSRNATCCNLPVVVDPTVDTGIKRDDKCWVTGDGKEVYTCQGMAARHMQGNMVKLCGCAVGFALVQLALAISGCVVRFPRLYSYCACCCKKKQKDKSEVAPATHTTPVTML